MPYATILSRVVPVSADEDRVAHRYLDGAELIVLADGAGGMTGGRQAAELIVRFEFRALHGPADCVGELRRLDGLLHCDASCGESTVVLLVASDGLLKYASRDRIYRVRFIRDLNAAAEELVAAAHLPSGVLQDDLSFVIVGPARGPG